jgi:hypothetical protein
VAWLTLKPGSRPRRIAAKVSMLFKRKINSSPYPIQKFPKLRKEEQPGNIESLDEDSSAREGLEDLSPWARKIYLELRTLVKGEEN